MIYKQCGKSRKGIKLGQGMFDILLRISSLLICPSSSCEDLLDFSFKSSYVSISPSQKSMKNIQLCPSDILNFAL